MPETKDLIDQILSMLKELQKEMDERFDAIGRRFDGIDKRLEEVASFCRTYRTSNDQPSELK
jgi:septation ring formation regulator EzrA